MRSPPHTRSRTEREDVVKFGPPHSVASQQTVQQSSPAAALPAATPSTPVARKRQRAEPAKPAEPRIVKFVVGKFRPSDIKDIKKAKKRLAKPQTQEALQQKEIIYLHRRSKANKGARKEALGGLLALRARHDEEGSDEVVEARPALPAPASSGVSAELEGSAELSPLPAPRAPGSGRAAPQTAPTSPAAPPPGGPAGQGPLAPLSPTTTVAFNALGTLAAQGWDCMATRCVWWILAAAREYRAARDNFEYRPQELQWVDSLSPTVATAHAVLTNPSHKQSSAACLVDQLRREQLGGPAVTEDQVERLLGFWLPSAKRLAALVGPGRTSLRAFLSRVYRAGQALVGLTVASIVPSLAVDAPAAPREPSTSARSAWMGRPSA
ncbi:hypothetical protein Emag_007149 [Eimeria magna]